MKYFIVFLCVSLSLLVESAKIPSYIQICKRSDPKVNQCIMQSVESLRSRLKNGIPELDTPPIEPLRVDNIEIARGFGQSHFNLGLNNVDVYGASDFKLIKLKVDIPNYTYKINVVFPKLRLIGDYNVDAQVLAFPVKGNGKFDANATDCTGTGILIGDVKTINGEKHMYFTDLNLNIVIGDYQLKVDNLFAGDPTLTQTINELLNQNKKDILGLAIPTIQAKASEILLEIANKIVKNFEYNEVFPEN